ncbi:adaptor protein MecA [Bacillus aquiflavi]|uniref:Adapter protein MecA n=1 Tax=Bacillus aquiflavi TaxID=2672567 RepID=A0A6B3VV14_9BACI|nr:adaptor protein MecA [Bacillus aquiflavi]MBA4536444.1 adaptor protein MecA [Bacillus aquiflavi]NEY80812.1 adaptor protein MecA [Bacillus aquiflavi]UAC49097.1 adaptor protein MecA [Bacillus aquiflavi]
MEIERINENTVKFYISYGDIEERGFDREEIWYNRERSEELFWEMMDEVHQEEEFIIEGPLWIQVQALEKGLEVLVTKAQLSKDGQKFELPVPSDKLKDHPVDDRIEELLDHHFTHKDGQIEVVSFDDGLEFLLSFEDFEDVIALSHQYELDELKTKLYSFEGKYYLYVEFDDDDDEVEIDNILSILLEYGDETMVTIHLLDEYGHLIISKDVFRTIRQHFS